MKVAVIALLLILSLFLFGCTSYSPSSSPATPNAASGISANVTAVVSSSTLPASNNQQPVAPSSTAQGNVTSAPAAEPNGVKEIRMTAKQWEFQPATVTVTRGDRVKLIVKSVDVSHGFALPDFNVNTRLEPGVDTIVEFTADKAGTFTFFCSVVCGSGHSEMRGSLVVVG